MDLLCSEFGDLVLKCVWHLLGVSPLPSKRLGIQIVHKMNKAPMADSQQIHALDAVPYLTIASWRGYLPAKNSGVFGFFQMKIHGKTTRPEMSLNIIIIFKLKSLKKIEGYSWALYLPLISGATLASRRVGHPKWSSQIETKQNVEVTGFAVWIRRFTPKIWHLQPETFEKILLITGKTAWT